MTEKHVHRRNQHLTALHIDPNAITIDVRENALSTFRVFPRELPHLKILLVDHNYFFSVDHFPVCPELRHLSCANNRIEGDLSVFLRRLEQECPHLETVNFAHNSITKIYVMNRKFLHFDHNIINRLEPAKVGNNIKYLSLHQNQLSSLAGLPLLPNADTVLIEANPILTFSDLPKGDVFLLLLHFTPEILDTLKLNPRELRHLKDFLQAPDEVEAWDRIFPFYNS